MLAKVLGVLADLGILPAMNRSSKRPVRLKAWDEAVDGWKQMRARNQRTEALYGTC